MVFSSLIFLCVFLPVVFLLYYLIPSIRAKNLLLIFFSLLFYAYGEPVYVLLMIASTLFNYGFGLLMRCKHRKAVLALSVVVNLSFLLVFKYADMMIGSVNTLFGLTLPLPHIRLPIGISFFTFQAMSYVIDVYRREVEPQKKYLNILLFVSLFPQLIAGPIVKYHDIEDQIDTRTHDFSRIAAGFQRFVWGLAKKVLIANTVAVGVDALFATPTAEINILSAWIAAIGYMLQIYYDFSGYSDMAIGLGHMFGFTFLENFRYPYGAVSIQDFWRKWHISLSTFFKEYVYIPLGGNRKGTLRTGLNKVLVFFTTGLWHGASWTFVIWGCYHGLFLLLEKALPMKKLNKGLAHVYTLLVVCVGFVIFRADTLTQGVQMIGRMFAGLNFTAHPMGIALEQLTPVFIAAVVIGCVMSFPVLDTVKTKLAARPKLKKIVEPITYICSLAVLVLCMLNLSSTTHNPFIYFRF